MSRTRLLLHVLDVSPHEPDEPLADPVAQARTIAAELRKYDPALQRRPRWIVLNKIDTVPPEERDDLVAKLRRRLRTKAPIFVISAATHEGCRDLMWAVQQFLVEHPPRDHADADAAAGGDSEPAAVEAAPPSGWSPI